MPRSGEIVPRKNCGSQEEAPLTLSDIFKDSPVFNEDSANSSTTGQNTNYPNYPDENFEDDSEQDFEEPDWEQPEDDPDTSEQSSRQSTTPEEDSEDDGMPVLGGDAYYGFIGDFLGRISPHTEACDASLLAHLLPALGTAIGPGPFLFNGGKHPCRLNTALVGLTSKARKGTSLIYIEEMMRLVNKEAWERWKWTGVSSGEGIVAALNKSSDKKIYVVEEEFSKVFVQAKREGNILSEIMRQAFDSGDLCILTKKNPLKVSNTHASFTGHITQEELSLKLPKVSLTNGFANRFLWFFTYANKIIPRPKTVPQSVLEDLADRVRPLIGLPASTIEFDDQSGELWDSIYPSLLEDQSGITARNLTIILRTSVIYSVLDENSGKIRLPHLQAGLAVWDYGRSSADIIFHGVTTTLTEKILLLLQKGPLKRGLFDRRISSSSAAISACLDSLLTAGKVKKEEVKPERGRTSTVWSLT